MEDYYYMAASPASSPEAEIDNYYIFPSLLSALRDKVRVEIEFGRSLGDETRARVNELEAHDDRGRLCPDD